MNISLLNGRRPVERYAVEDCHLQPTTCNLQPATCHLPPESTQLRPVAYAKSCDEAALHILLTGQSLDKSKTFLVARGFSQFTIYDLRCTIYDVRFTMYDVRCTMYDGDGNLTLLTLGVMRYG